MESAATVEELVDVRYQYGEEVLKLSELHSEARARHRQFLLHKGNHLLSEHGH